MTSKNQIAERKAAELLWAAIIGVRNIIADDVSGDTSIFHRKVGELLIAKVKEDKTGEQADNAGAALDTVACLSIFTLDDQTSTDDTNEHRILAGIVPCRFCGSNDCDFSCDESQAAGFDQINDD